MRLVRHLVHLLVLLVVLAGCTSKGPGTTVHADATDPMLMPPPDTPGYGYDGAGMVAATGSMVVHADNAANQGYVTVALDVPSGPYQGNYAVNWTDFHIQPGAAWQDGGIACGPGLVEHGASGHGNKMEPQFDIDCAGWGTATLTRNGTAVTDPVTGATAFNAHFMLTKEAMLQPGGKVVKADRTSPFDPHTPGDGYVDPSRMEAHLALWGPGAYQSGIAAPQPKANTTTFQDTATGAAYTKDYRVRIDAVATRLAVRAQVGQGVGRITVTLKDPSGTVVDSKVATTLQAAQLAIPDGPMQVGNYTLNASGAGADAAYVLTTTVTPPAPFLLHAVFRTVHLG